MTRRTAKNHVGIRVLVNVEELDVAVVDVGAEVRLECTGGGLVVFDSENSVEFRSASLLTSEGATFQLMFMMNTDSKLFRTMGELEGDGWSLSGNIYCRESEECLPLYEGKMIHQFDHRWATYEDGQFRLSTTAEKQDPSFAVMPRYWVASEHVLARSSQADWAVGWRDIGLFGYEVG